MGWADLIKRKASKFGLSSKAAQFDPAPRLRWFGKLPTYADYYCSPGDEPWAQEFNDWILQGYEIYHRRLVGSSTPERPIKPARDRMLPLSECVIRLPKSGMTVLASIQDYGGDMRGRHFPLCFYAGLPTAEWPGPTSERLGGAVRALRDLMGLRHEVMRFCNAPGRFEAVFGERSVDLSGIAADDHDGSWIEDARAIPLDEWFDVARAGLKVDDASCWFRLANQWGRSIAENESDAFEPTLRFPLAPRFSPQTQLAGWIRWLQERMDLGRRSLSLMMSAGPAGGNGHVCVIAREIVADDFLLMTPLADTLTYVDDLSLLKDSGDSSVESAGEGAGGTGPSPTAHWAEFVGATA